VQMTADMADGVSMHETARRWALRRASSRCKMDWQAGRQAAELQLPGSPPPVTWCMRATKLFNTQMNCAG
jgi:hypothetical protein